MASDSKEAVMRQKILWKAGLFSFYGIVLAALTLFCLIQGIVSQLQVNYLLAIGFYIAALFSAIACMWTYVQAKSKIDMASIFSWK